MKVKLLFSPRLWLSGIVLMFLFGQLSILTAQVALRDREGSSGGNSPEKVLKENARRLNNPTRKRPKNTGTSGTTATGTAARNTSTRDATARNTAARNTSPRRTVTRDPVPPASRAVDVGDQVDDAIDLGNDQRKAQRYSEAERAYRVAIRLDPKDSRGYVGLGNIYSDQKKYPDALSSFSEAIRLNPEDPAGYFGRGYAYYLMGDKDEEALADGKQAVRLNTDEDAALWGIVILYNNRQPVPTEKNRLEEAVLFYKEQIRRRPDYAKAYIALGWAYELWKQPEKTVEYYQQAIRVRPDYAEAYKWLGEVYNRLGQTAAARASYSKEADAYRRKISHETNRDNLYTLYNSLGEAYNYRLDDYTSAIEVYRQAVAINPDAYSGIVWSYARLKNYAAAIEAYKQWINARPNNFENADLYLSMGDLYRDELKQPALAREAYLKAVNLYKEKVRNKPDDDAAYARLGYWYYGRLELYADAAEAYKQAARLKPDSSEYFSSLGDAYREAQRYPEAIEAYQQVVRIRATDPNSTAERKAYSYNDLGVVYYRSGRYAEAIDAYQQAVRLNAKLDFFYTNLAAAHYQLWHFNEAIDASNQALRLDARNPSAHYHLGESYIALDNKRGAEEQLNFFNSASDEYKKAHDGWITPFKKDFYKKWPSASR